MAKRVCTEPGCPTLVDAGRCAEHRRERDRQRGTRQERGYAAAHDRLRASYQRRMAKGERFTCWRCPTPTPIDPAAWHLGHCDDDRRLYHGPECISCNTATSGRADQRCPHPNHLARASNGVG